MTIDTILLALIAAILVALSLWAITVTIAIGRNVAWLRVAVDHIRDIASDFDDNRWELDDPFDDDFEDESEDD